MSAEKISPEMKNFNAAIGKRIKYYQKLRKITLETLAKKVGVTLNQIILYERGDCDIRISRLKAIADILQVPVHELIPEADPEIYMQLPEDLLEFITYLFKHKIDLKSAKNLIKSYKKEKLL